MKFAHKILLLPLLAALAFVVVFAITWQNTQRSGRILQRIEDQVFPALEVTYEMEKVAVQTRHALSDAVTLGDEDMIALADEHAGSFHDLLTRARRIGSLDESSLRRLEAAFTAWYSQARSATRDLIMGDLSPEVLAHSAEMNRQYEELLGQFETALGHQQQEMAGSLSRARKTHRLSRTVVSSSIVIAFVLIVLTGSFITRSLLRPLRVLISGTEEIATGNLKARIDYYAADEMGRLADSFRHMQESLIADITRRAEAEEKLRASRERLRAILETTSVGVSIVRPDGSYIGANQAWARMLGFEDEKELLRQNVLDLTHPEDRDESARLLARLVNGEVEQYQHQKRYLRKDGSSFWGDLYATPLRDAEGQLDAVLGMVLDITDRRRAEEALRESEEKYRELVQHARSIILRWDTQGRILLMNEFGLDFLGYEEEEIVGQHVVGTIVPETESTGRDLRSLIRQMGENPEGFETNENEMQRRDGSRAWISWANRPLFDEEGRFREILSVGVDITDRKRAEAALRESEERFRSIFENATNGMFRTHVDGRVVAVNPAATRQLGYDSPGQLIAKVENLATDVYAETEDRVRVLEAMKRDGQVITEVPFQKRDGSRIMVRLNMWSVEDDEGEVRFIEGFFEDITEQKRAEEELRIAQKKLVENAHLAGMAEIATSVLHNVGNVLNSATTSTTVARGMLKKSRLPTLGRLAEVVRRQEEDLPRWIRESEQGRKLPSFLDELAGVLAREREQLAGELETLERSHDHIRQIIALQQNYAGVAGVRERVTLAELVQDAVRLFGDSFSRHHIEFEIVDPEEGLSATLDKHRVLQIVINLLKNARDALKQSEAEPRRITVEMDRDEKQRTRIRVRDNGVGIPPGKLERIFNYGFTTKEEGHGYGLHGSANAAREMGGRLTAASEGEGRGACFTLLLPPEAGRRT